MKLLTRYITVEILKIFALVLVAVISLYLCVDFMEKVDDFLEAGASVRHALFYLVYKIPFIFVQITPVGVLIAVLIAFGMMSKHNEITALHSTGISTTTLLAPTLAFGAATAFLLVFIAEVLSPQATAQANRIWLTQAKNQPPAETRDRDIWLKTNRAIVHFRYYHHGTQTARGISYNRFDKDFKLIYRLDADSGRFDAGQWHLQKVLEQKWQPASDGYSVQVSDSATKDLGISPEDLKTVARDSSEMGFMELLAYIRKVETEGYDATRYWVDLHAKAAFPFACLILSLLGLGVVISGLTRGAMVINVILGLGIVFVYWVLFSFCLSLGYGGILPAFIAVWLANFVFFCLGWVLFLYAR